MGKYTNCVATFDDITDIGYQVPGQYTYASKEGVTYGDLRNLESNGRICNLNISASLPDTKCVVWQNVPGVNGQTPNYTQQDINNMKPPATGIYVPIVCHLSRPSGSATNANVVTFNYKYKLSGETSFRTSTTGKAHCSDLSNGKLSSYAAVICWVMLNPKVSGTVTQATLEINCGTATYKQDFSFTTNVGHSTSWSDTKSISYSFDVSNQDNYNHMIQQLTDIYITIVPN